MKRAGGSGFTLIELLTVIAIITILTGLTAVVLSRAREKARIARSEAALNGLRTEFVAYSTKHNESFPPAYGYLLEPWKETLPAAQQYCLRPYMALLGHFREDGLYDEFSVSYDTDRNKMIGLLEYSPLGTKTGPDEYTFDNTLFAGPRAPQGEEFDGKRPYVYIPVNKAQAKKVAKYYYRVALTDGRVDDGMNARVWDSTADELQGLRFPPPRYDAFVLIGVGPAGNTWGVADPDPAVGEPPEDDPAIYHIRALRAYFLATRDANENMKPDFDLRNRTGAGGEDASPASYADKGFPVAQYPLLCLLPVQAAGEEAAPGPIIYVYE